MNATADPRWTAVLQRDPQADGRFVYAVRTTGTWAHPSSASRLPRPENVEFFDTVQAAEAAGYRPSQRAARTDQAAQHARLVARACRAIESSASAPTLADLAADAGLSPHHFHRIFKSVTGVTPAAWARAERARRLRAQLAQPQAATITDAIYAAGFNASSRYYEAADDMLGMQASAFRDRGADARIRFAVGQCSLGAILVAASSRGICAITLGDDPQQLVQELQDRFARAELIGADAAFEQLVARVVGLVEAPQTGLDLPLDLRGTAFQQRVWQALRAIPVGSTASYAEIAQRIGQPRATRAVAQACAANPVAVAIPCHRVVRSDGDVSGYRWGVARKKALLEREDAAR